MTPGERITLIRESARLLAAREWADIDLVLQQFGLPIDNDSHGGEYRYVLDMIANAPDADLRQLHSFLVGESDTPFVAQPWAENQLKLFMSHLAIHQEFVGEVACRHLMEARPTATPGIQPFNGSHSPPPPD